MTSLGAGRTIALLAVCAVAAGVSASAQKTAEPKPATLPFAPVFTPGNLVVSRSVYTGTASTVTVGQTLPPNCINTTANGDGCATAIANGVYPQVFNNDTADGSFGVTSPIYLDQLTPAGALINSVEVPNFATTSSSDHLVTSFSSKSELALHLSTDGNYLTFIDYVAPINTLDASNSNTALAPDPANPVPSAYYRAAATVNAAGKFTFTETNAYSGNNGRAAILVNTTGDDFFYTAGNAGNGGTPQAVVEGAGAQIIEALNEPESEQDPGAPTPVASFSITEIPGNTKADKIGKDDNFRGMTLFNNILYFTKGSGSNGIDTVYFVDTTGRACPNGVGLPIAGAALPTTVLGYNSTVGVTPKNMCVLKGFPTVLAKPGIGLSFPFGLWFANATTLYVADEGNGTTTFSGGAYTAAAASTNTGGLQKWIFNSTTQAWQLAYTLKTGLNLGTPYTIAGYPTGNNSTTKLPWAPATDGLRNIIGTLQGNRIQGQYAVIWATSSTVSGNGDQGADPNKLYLISDKISNTSATVAAEETFTDLRDAQYGEVLRGVSFTPGTAVASY